MGLGKKKSVLVVANDAGTAEMIAGYVRVYAKKYTFFCYVAGPAVKIFRREHIPYSRVSEKTVSKIVRKHRGVSFVLAGTGWMTHIESAVVSEAKKAGLKTVAYLDSHTDYRLRFGYPKPTWWANLPDEFWVGDKHDMACAKRQLPARRVHFVRNRYIASIVARYRKAKKIQDSVLFLSRETGEVKSLFAKLMAGFSRRATPPLVLIRSHPAESQTFHDHTIKKYQGRVRISKSNEDDITCDLLRARIVVGMETNAMVISGQAGITTVCVMSPREMSFLPPFRSITRVPNAEAALRLI